MIFENMGYIILLLIASFSTCMLSVFTYLRARGKPGVKAYFALALASSVYAFGYAFELASDKLPNMLFWLKVEYLGIPIIPVLCLIMSLAYTGHERYLKRNFFIGLFFIPAITYIIYYTNDIHHLFYKSILLRTDEAFPILLLGKGPWYWVHIAYSYICIIGGILILMSRWPRGAFSYRMQAISMSIGLFLPLLGNLIYIAGYSPSGIDLGPVMMSIASPFHVWALLSFGMFNLVPVARGKVFESMRDGVIVLDQFNRIVDYNPAAAAVIPNISPEVVGKQVNVVLEKLVDLKEALDSGIDESDIKLVKGKTLKHFNVRLSPIVKRNGEQIGRIIVLNNITERVALYENLRMLASVDGLTKIYNRSHFMYESKKELDRIKHQGGSASVMMLDIDHFKEINDTFGHETGDIVIKQMVLTCKALLREGDMFGRYGGEEFIIFLPLTEPKEAQELAEEIRKTIADLLISIPEGATSITASFGIAGGDSSFPDIDMDLLLREADKALYRAKNKGRNRVENWSFQALS